MKAKYKCKGCGNHYCAKECPNGCDKGFYTSEDAPDMGQVKELVESAYSTLNKLAWPGELVAVKRDLAAAIEQMEVA